MGVTGTWPELLERALNIIYISLKFLEHLSIDVLEWPNVDFYPKMKT